MVTKKPKTPKVVITPKEITIEPVRMPLICKEVIEIKYDLNWFYMREKILSFSPKTLWKKWGELCQKI